MKKVQPSYKTLVITVENKFGVLARVSGLFSRRGVNIKSLAVAPTDKDEFSRITVDVDIELESVSLDQIINQLEKLINVVEIRALDPSQSVERELMIVQSHAQVKCCEIVVGSFSCGFAQSSQYLKWNVSYDGGCVS